LITLEYPPDQIFRGGVAAEAVARGLIGFGLEPMGILVDGLLIGAFQHAPKFLRQAGLTSRALAHLL
jgi:hypothetical protein